jgi:putative membrane protein
MMSWYGNGAMSGWGWTVGMIVFWGALITLGVAWRYRRHGPVELAQAPAGGARPPSEQILAERYARGEMDESEYSTRLATLRQAEHS